MNTPNLKRKKMAIKYAIASLKKFSAHDTRRQIMLNWVSDASTEMNRIQFKLTDRFREYLSNIPQEELDSWPKHKQILDEAKNKVKENRTWIGKGLVIQKYQKGKSLTSLRYINTGAILTYNEDYDIYEFEAYVDDMKFRLQLFPSDIELYPYKGEREYGITTTNTAVKGNWK
jgi:hypothetical protein